MGWRNDNFQSMKLLALGVIYLIEVMLVICFFYILYDTCFVSLTSSAVQCQSARK